MDAQIITDLLRRRVSHGVLMAHDVKLAEWLAIETDAPNWVRMIAGANPEVFDNPLLYDALIEEVSAQMEK